ncbi:MAG: protein translocase subunit SecD, partial [Bdellovibrionia bacterium]
YEDNQKKDIVQHAIETLRNRIDEFGVSEPSITAQGSDRILIQLPGLEDATRAKELINKTARLDFMMVHEKIGGEELQGWISDAEKAGAYSIEKMKYSDYVKRLNEDLKAKFPPNTKILFAKNEQARDIQSGKVPYIVETNNGLGGDSLRDAFVTMGEYNEPEISMNFKPAGALKFDELTGSNSGRQMAIVLDDVVYSAPNIKERISTGSARITLGGGRDYNTQLEEAKMISMALRAGALPAKLEQLEERTVGPSLGSDSVAAGMKATIIGALLVLGFMLIYYKVFGIFANLALMLNVAMIYAGLTVLEATLTLPGIAGIALTIGMAVDANIVINERIKEELRRGLNFAAAFREGYQKAFIGVFDSHVTSALTCVVLIYYGTGPVRGFGVTLLIGLVASLFTAIFVTRTIVDYLLNRRKITSIPI